MVTFVLHHAGVETIGLTQDVGAFRVLAAVADARPAGHLAAQARDREAAFPAVDEFAPPTTSTGFTTSTFEYDEIVPTTGLYVDNVNAYDAGSAAPATFVHTDTAVLTD